MALHKNAPGAGMRLSIRISATLDGHFGKTSSYMKRSRPMEESGQRLLRDSSQIGRRSTQRTGENVDDHPRYPSLFTLFSLTARWSGAANSMISYNPSQVFFVCYS